jgi:hypothetical protein
MFKLMRIQKRFFNQSTGLALLVCFALLATIFLSIGRGDTFVAFGPENFVRGTGAPVDVIRNCSVRNPDTTRHNYTLRGRSTC